MKKLSAVSYMLILCTTLVNGHNPEEVNWDHKTFDTLSECMSGNVSDRTQSNCGKIIGEWVKANRNDSEDSTTTEITPKQDGDYIQIKIKGKIYDDTMREIHASNDFWQLKKYEHKIDSNPFVCNTHDKNVIEEVLVDNIINHSFYRHTIPSFLRGSRHLMNNNMLLRKSLYDRDLSYDMAKPPHLKEFFIPYALKQLENKIIDDENTRMNYSDDDPKLLNQQMENFIPPCIELSNYPGNTQNPQEVKSTLLPLSEKLNKLRIYINHGSSTDEKKRLSCKLSNLTEDIDEIIKLTTTENSNLNSNTIIQKMLRSIPQQLRSIPPELQPIKQSIKGEAMLNRTQNVIRWWKLRPYLLDNLWYCAAINASTPLLEEASSSNDDPKQYSNTTSPHEKLSNKTALEVAEEMRDWHCDENNDTFYNSEECDHRRKFFKTFKNSFKEWNNKRTKQN